VRLFVVLVLVVGGAFWEYVGICFGLVRRFG